MATPSDSRSASRSFPPRPPSQFCSAVVCTTVDEDKESNAFEKEDLENLHIQYDEDKAPNWNDFFDTYEDLQFDAGNEKKDIFRVYIAGNSGPIVFCFHGGGHTALSFALVAVELKSNMRVIAFDSRGHGRTKTVDECEDGSTCDMSVNTLIDDALRIIKFFCDKIKNENENKALPSIILLGHSMGGAIATRTAASGEVENLKGLVVLDVVEGIAMEALPCMSSIVNRIPRDFRSVEDSISWVIKSNQITNVDSAKISVPSQLVRKDNKWIWRCDLNKTQKFWDGWFRGLSKAFLSVKCVKLLVLAGQDRLDKELMIAHMQGKFQLHIIQHSGHVIEEDQPSEVVKLINEFVHRYKLDVF